MRRPRHDSDRNSIGLHGPARVDHGGEGMRTYKAQAINRTSNVMNCSECGDVIEPDDYYFIETVKHTFSIVPDDKYAVCVGCHENDKEAADAE